ncbi:MAG: hypothetical protein JSS64_04810 [Bacteroidetes bacterium]|nr:hypothetical protein [Bacteroidota bacterium]
MNTDHSKLIVKQVFNLLRFAFIIVPIVAGVDKFTNILTHWDQYISPTLTNMLPISASMFMMIVGVIEIIAGIIVMKKPDIGGYIVAAWLTVIALSLIFSFKFVDVAVRDLVMAISAFSMARLSKVLS